jgi:hypothetical protein
MLGEDRVPAPRNGVKSRRLMSLSRLRRAPAKDYHIARIAPGCREPGRPGSLHIDDQLEMRWLLDREVSRLSSFKNAVHEICRTSIQSESTICANLEVPVLTL